MTVATVPAFVPPPRWAPHRGAVPTPDAPIISDPSFTPPRVHTPLPGLASRAALARAERALNPATLADHRLPFVQVSYRDVVIEDLDGNTFADFLSAWGAAPWGNDPVIAAAVGEALSRYGTQISEVVLTPPAAALAERLVSLTPVPGARCEFSVSGTLAVESAVRIMRAATNRALVVTFAGTYHGNSTTLTAAMSSDVPSVSAGAVQYAPGVISLPFPQQFRSPWRPGPGPHDDTEVLEYLESWILTHQHSPDQIAGVLIEPVLSEGGVHLPSPAFWTRLQAMCERYEWILCLDEVQTGIGRCGPLFAAELWGLTPDMVLCGKALSAGGPAIAAIVARAELLERADLSQGSTFGWQPAACAASLAGLELWEAHPGAATALGAVLLETLRTGVGHGYLAEVRGTGALIGFELTAGPGSMTPVPDVMWELRERLLARGVVVIIEEGKSYARMMPPYRMSHELARWSAAQVLAELEQLWADRTQR